MAWIKVDQTLPTHRKILLLATLLGKKKLPGGSQQASGMMVTFWIWALDNFPGGDLSGIPPVVIASAVGWPDKESGALVEALVNVGFLDPDMQIHDWGDYAGALVERRKRDSDRKKADRAKKKDGHPQPVRRTSDGHDADSPQDVRKKSAPRVEKSREEKSNSRGSGAREDDDHDNDGPSDEDVRFAVQRNLDISEVEAAARGIGLPVAPAHLEQINDYLAQHPKAWVLQAIMETADAPSPSWKYFKGVMRGYRDRGGPDSASARASPGASGRAPERGGIAPLHIEDRTDYSGAQALIDRIHGIHGREG